MSKEAIALTIPKITDNCNSVTKKNFQILLAICGTTGVGKSTLAIEIAQDGDPNFTIEKNVLFNPSLNEVMKKIKELPYGSYIVLDEAINICYKMEWYSETNRLMGKFLNLCRKERKKIIFCIPNFGDMSKHIRELMNMWIEVISRGEAIVFVKNPIVGGQKWQPELMYKHIAKRLRHKRYADITTSDIRYYLRRNQHYLGELKFLKLEAKVEAEYEFLRDKVKYDGLELINNEKESQVLIRIYRYTLSLIGFTYEQIGDITGITKQAISGSLNSLDKEIKSRVKGQVNSILYSNGNRNKDILQNNITSLQNSNFVKKGETQEADGDEDLDEPIDPTPDVEISPSEGGDL